MSRTPDIAQKWMARTTKHLGRFRLGPVPRPAVSATSAQDLLRIYY